MDTIRIDIPDGLLRSMGSSPETAAGEIRVSMAVRWYGDRRIDLKNAAQFAGLSEPKLLESFIADRLSAAGESRDEMAYARALEQIDWLSRRPERNAAIEWVRSFQRAEPRARALCFLAEGSERQQRNQLLSEAREAALNITVEPNRSRLLAKLAAQLTSAGEHQAAMAAAEAIGNERLRVDCMVEIAPSFTPAQLAKAIDSAKAIRDDEARQRALNCLSLILGTPGTPLPARSAVDSRNGSGRFSTKEAESHYRTLGRWKGPASTREAQKASREFWRRSADPGIRWLVRRLRSERRVDALHGAASLLADLGTNSIKPILKELKRDPSTDQSLALLQALSWIAESVNPELKTIGAEVVLARFLQHHEPDLREAAARAMRTLAPDRSSHWLRNRLRDEQSADVRATLEEELAVDDPARA